MTNSKLALSPSVVKYLLALDALGDAEGIHTVDVARYLNVKKPSAHTMLNNLRDADIITKDDFGMAHLTRCGSELTERCRRYYTAVSDALHRALPDGACIKNAACTLVSELDEEILEELCRINGTEGQRNVS